jgi:hypothetical protein
VRGEHLGAPVPASQAGDRSRREGARSREARARHDPDARVMARHSPRAAVWLAGRGARLAPARAPSTIASSSWVAVGGIRVRRPAPRRPGPPGGGCRPHGFAAHAMRRRSGDAGREPLGNETVTRTG